MTMVRCAWVRDPLEQDYHDQEWGVPVHDDQRLFEFLILEGMQAGLSWLTILRKRARFREVFAGFDPAAVAGYGPDRLEALAQDAGIVRNRLKLQAAVTNARAFLDIQAQWGGFDSFVWRYVEGIPIQNAWTAAGQVPAQTVVSAQLSKDLQAHGFRFVGPTICYAFMQAVGMVNDHTTGCFRHGELRAEGIGRRL